MCIKDKTPFKLIFLILFGFWMSGLNAQYNSGLSEYHFKNGLPEDFTEINVEVLNEPTADGYVFFAMFGAWGLYEDLVPYQIIADNYGTPVFYKKNNQSVMDFKLQPNGYLSYYGDGGFQHHFMDSSYKVIEDIGVLNYGTDFHEFIVLEDGNYLLLGTDYRIVDMDTVVAGGHEGVTVIGALIQIQTPDQEVLFEWSSWDHFEITDAADYQVNLTDPDLIDYVHANSLEMDTDSTILMSCRNMDEITKINMNTGEIMWRLGGENNEFTYTNDTMGFYMQHDIRRLPDGTYQIFDNGTQHDPPFSNVLRYSLDEENKTATLVERIRSQPDDILGWIMGNAQLLPNGNTFVGWGDGIPNITEFDTAGQKVLEFSFEGMTYRAFRFPWETNAFSFDQDALKFDDTHPLDSSTRSLNITNNLDEPLIINHLVSRTGKYLIADDVQVEIPAGEAGQITIRFKPEEEGIFDDVLTVCYDVENDDLTQRIAKQIPVEGLATEEAGSANHPRLSFTVYPNPVTQNTIIELEKRRSILIEVFDHMSCRIRSLTSEASRRAALNLENLKDGVYFLKITDRNSGEQSIRKIIKTHD